MVSGVTIRNARGICKCIDSKENGAYPTRVLSYMKENLIHWYLSSKINWDIVFKSGLSKFCGRQPLKNLKGYSLIKQIISRQKTEKT